MSSEEQDLEFLNYIESSSKALKSLENETSGLRIKLAELQQEKVILEKVASQPVFSNEKLSNMLDMLADRRMIDPDYKEKVASIISEDPGRILELMSKLANATHESGRSISKSQNDNNEDPDGWGFVTNLR
tara:strand:+ start:46 stop:438 length:393 start_codon:yes stop_codon:yes gene_type:complete